MSLAVGDPGQERLDHVGRVVLLPLLAVATVLAGLSVPIGYGPAPRFRAGLVVAAAAAAWTAAVTMRRRGHRVAFAVLGFLVHTALAAVLVGVNPWFGVFAYTGYLLAGGLPGRWPTVGFVVTALIVAGSQVGGFPVHEPTVWVGYLLIAAVNVVLVLTLARVVNRVVAQNAERGRIIAENAGLHAQLVAHAHEAGIQDERQRLAGEIHDTLAQGLIGVVTQLEAAEQARHVHASWQHHLDQARELARASLTEARRSVRALRPEQLEHATLDEAVAELSATWTSATGTTVHRETVGSACPLATEVESTLFRVAQEGLTNVAKHADAETVWLTLTYLDDVVLLDVRDDGVGCRPGTSAAGYGLEGMRLRLARVGGTLSVETAPDEGTVLSAAIPIGAAR